MNSQLYLANGMIEGRVHPDRNPALLRDLELARRAARRTRRSLRARTR